MKWYHWVGIGTVGTIILSQVNRVRVMSNLKDIQLSKNFTLAELVRTSTGLDNIPDQTAIEALRALAVTILQPLRDYFKKPVNVSSGYRSSAVNEAQYIDANKNGVRDPGEAGSSKTSQHQRGEAADIWIDGVTNQQIIDAVRSLKLPYDQMIDEVRTNMLTRKVSSWVHISHNNRGASQRLQWLTRRDGPNGEDVYATVKVG